MENQERCPLAGLLTGAPPADKKCAWVYVFILAGGESLVNHRFR
jgi:hypothetical protein